MFDKESPFVSVIVPVRNEERFIADCLTNLLNQDYPQDRLKLIVVDNNSTDRSRTIIRQFPVQYVFEKRKGVSKARNTGARVARGDLLAFVDGDCVAPRDWISRLVTALWDQSADACIGTCVFPQGGSFVEDYLALRGIDSQRELLNESRPFPPWLLTGNLLVRRTIFEKVAGFEETLARGEDADFWWKIERAGGCLKYFPRVQILRRGSSSLINFYSKKFLDGKVSVLLEHRHASLSFQSRGKSTEFLEKDFTLRRRLKKCLQLLFFTENNLSFFRKVAYLLLACSGYFSFQVGQWLNRIRFDVMRMPLPVSAPERRPAFPAPHPQTEMA